MKKKGWKELPEGAIIPAAPTSPEFKTGDWRIQKPVWNEDKCVHCLLCWLYCPDSAIKVKDGKVVAFDYEYCKGCGICGQVCPPKIRAIEMVKEEI